MWALNLLGKIDPSKPIAVIGGGLTGVTAATALVNLGHRVDLYEHRSELMAHQLLTDHRLIHPSINQWPFAPLLPATSLPFLNWVSGPCRNVISDLLVETEQLQRKHETRFNIFKNQGITDIDKSVEGYSLSNGGLTVGEEQYGLVFLTIGFGEERNHSDFPAISYWRPDEVESEAILRTTKNFFVSGCGDGGLIDALRVAHRDFNKGGIIFDAANALERTDIAETVKNAEINRLSSDELARIYLNCAEMIKEDSRYSEINQKLLSSANRQRPIVRLSSNSNTPFGSRAAPIHKLLIAHGMSNDRVFFNQSSVGADRHFILIGGRQYPKNGESMVIIRHGPQQLHFTQLIDEDHFQKLQESQLRIEEVMANPQWGDAYPMNDREPASAISSRLLGKATRALRLLQAGVVVSATDAGYDVAVPSRVSIDHLPRELFGLPVNYSSS